MSIERNNDSFDVSIPMKDKELYRYFTDDELNDAARELSYIEEYPVAYKSYKNRKDLKEALLKDE